MQIVTRTVYGAAIQSAHYLGLPYAPPEKSTLNEKFGIHQTETPGANERQAMQYLCIGNRGHRVISGADGIAYTNPVNHRTTDAACFGHVPFVLREMADDLPIDQRNLYALRRVEVHNNTNYVAYYAKRIDLSEVVVNLQHTQTSDGSKITAPFVPSNDNLNPTPLIGQDDDNAVIETNGEYVSSSAVVTIPFNETDAAEFRNVARILYGDEKYAVISELALVAGIDRVLTGQSAGNTTVNYNEVIAAQVTAHIATYYHLVMQNNGFTFTSDVGIAEPLFALASST